MKEIISALFGAGLIINAALFVPQALHLWKVKRADGVSIPSFVGFCAIQAIGVLDGYFQHDGALLVGMSATLATCGTATALAIYFSIRARHARGAGEP